MNMTSIVNSVSQTMNTVKFQAQKHSPEILMVLGIGGIVASCIGACKATLKVNEVLDETKTNVEAIHEATETGITQAGEEYTAEDSKKDLVVTYAQTGIKLAKLYGPSVCLGVLSIGCMVKSNSILHKRNVALAAAYATVDKGFKEYRGRVVDRFGENVDRELKYNLKAKKVTETEVDEETGKEKKVKKTKNYVDRAELDERTRFFEKYTRDEYGNVVRNHKWDPDHSINVAFLKNTQRFMNDRLIVERRITLNDIYKELGFPTTDEGFVIGWTYEPDNPDYRGIDFGIWKSPDNYSDYIYSEDDDEALLLSFNPDGYILAPNKK